MTDNTLDKEIDEILKPLTPKILALSGGLGVKLDNARMEIKSLIAQAEKKAEVRGLERKIAHWKSDLEIGKARDFHWAMLKGRERNDL